MGITQQLEIDYQQVQIEPGDVFVLITDGVYEHVDAKTIATTIQGRGDARSDFESVAKSLVEEALKCGSTDNLTLQIVRVEALPPQEAGELYKHLYELPFPPILEPRAEFDGYRIVRELQGSSRSHIYLAVDNETDTLAVIKTPSIDLQGDAAYLERFLTEEWVARRISSARVLKPSLLTRKRNFIYVVTEFIEGQTLAQWMLDNPKPELEAVRGIVEHVAKGLRAFHRLEMLHQDLRPDNIMIDTTGTVKIIDFGSTRVASLAESTAVAGTGDILVTYQYTAPEYFLGESGSPRSDIFSLGVITYYMLAGRLPYGAEVSRARSRAAQHKLMYASVLADDREIPAWIDDVLRKAVHPTPAKRYGELSEFLVDLRHPNAAFLNKTCPALIERNPLLFWKCLSVALALAVVVLLGLRTIR
jgi:serine/threonine protein kinase